MTLVIHHTLSLVLCLMLSQSALGQTSDKMGRQIREAIITDSASSIMFPITYSAALFTSNKAMTWGNYYANFIVHDFKADTYRKLFPEDVFIDALDYEQVDNYSDFSSVRSRIRLPTCTHDWMFYKVRAHDYNASGKIDDKDPVVLYVSNRKGEGLKPLTPKNENVISFTVYEKLGFAMVKIQRDANQDRNFKTEDEEFYLVKIDLATLTLGNKFETGGVQ